MPEIILDEEFERILPKLDEQVLLGLENNLLEFGCLMPLVLWNGILIDGYNRYSILSKHNLPFNTINMEFNSREDVKIWIIEHQVSQRNLNPMQLCYYRGLHYNLEKRSHGEIERLQGVSPKLQNATLGGSTAKRLAKLYKISRDTIIRDSKVATALDKIGETSPDVKMDILSGKISITRKQLKELESSTDDDVDSIVTQIIDGTFEKPKSDSINTVKRDVSSISFPASLQSISAINEITNTFYSELRKLSSNEDVVGSKTALRLYIDTLEKLYSRM